MLFKDDKKYILNTYARNYTNFKKGKNATLFDEKNNDYIDFTSGVGVVSVGHGNKKVAKAISKQVSKLTHTSNLFVIEPQIKLAKKIKDLSNLDISMFFANSGAEANEGAIKIARKYGNDNYEGKRFKIITLENSFHGRTIATIKATGQDKMHQASFSPYPDGFFYVKNLEDIYNAIDDNIVAVMIELIQGEGGVQHLDRKAVQELAKFLKQKDILLIVDEVQTGAYRTGEFLASNYYEIKPDIITMAKGIGGGVPIGIVATTLKNIFSAGDHGSTFGGNFLVTTAAKEVLNILEENKKNGNLDKTIKYFDAKLTKLFENNKDIFTSKVGIGLIKGLRVIDEPTLAKIIKEALDKRILVLKAGRSTLRFLPPLSITKKEINLGFKRLNSALKAIK